MCSKRGMSLMWLLNLDRWDSSLSHCIKPALYWINCFLKHDFTDLSGSQATTLPALLKSNKYVSLYFAYCHVSILSFLNLYLFVWWRATHINLIYLEYLRIKNYAPIFKHVYIYVPLQTIMWLEEWQVQFHNNRYHRHLLLMSLFGWLIRLTEQTGLLLLRVIYNSGINAEARMNFKRPDYSLEVSSMLLTMLFWDYLLYQK